MPRLGTESQEILHRTEKGGKSARHCGMVKRRLGIAMKSSEFKFQCHYFWLFPIQIIRKYTLLEESNEMMEVLYKL